MTWQRSDRPETPGDAPRTAPPITPPVGPATLASSSLVNQPDPFAGLTNDGAHTGTTHPPSPAPRRTKTTPNHRNSASDIDAIRYRLSTRDIAIIETVAQHRMLSSRQIEILHFDRNAPSAAGRIARDVLGRLRSMRLIGALDRHIGGTHGGSRGAVHYVDVVGDRLLRDRPGRAARRPHEPTERFVRHTLAVADAHIELISAHRRGDLELVESSVEPASWRTHTGVGGARLTLKPDLSAETATDNDYVHAWFIEIDLGTESIPTLLRKCHDYEAYRQTGIEQDRHGSFPLVVWSITHRDPAKGESRRQALADAIARDRRLPSALFRIVAPEQLLPLIRNGGGA
ncbi:replication-relaxation family protein [Mycobacteroides abscessus]|uniref:replication-relaxation family protein n=1 Tax=Mycobacteroides abscessus TaxID=36809 RepID=UPI000C256E2A|nr:replication-relaxation family protein [Mycobacteroides abscessus]MDM2496001.1 replication-relaxation family protein [Mycobacteroides abscessus]MDM2514640.1 replication-relaxation family protein [Mycobacteroides abscessus]MDM2523572.1 replication-relaxation family protein [Mycobacteroides abscessus]MDM2529801.1 replication-relaxation family protein [Mycobacteroides abscessus]MDM2531346.1 replication-relaxation family protein [Mycobacteroides abscessus]